MKKSRTFLSWTLPVTRNESEKRAWSREEWREHVEARKALASHRVALASDETSTADLLLLAQGGLAVHRLKELLQFWKDHEDEALEEVWQEALVRHPVVISQLFAVPIFVLQGKAYVGGKSIDNKKGAVVDILVANELTGNVALVEIKTPKTVLVGPSYRGRVHSMSTDLIGAVVQALDYRDSLEKHFHELTSGSSSDFSSFRPRCLVIAGHELFRSSLGDLQIVTYDELFRKLEFLVRLLGA